MRKLWIAVVTVVLFLGLAAGTVVASPTYADGQPDLTVESIGWEPQTIYPGAEVTATITYKNVGMASVPETAEITLTLTIGDPETDPKVLSTLLEEAKGLGTDELRSAIMTFNAPAEQRTYPVLVFIDSGETLQEQDEGNNKLETEITVESALPESIARLFTGLGVFAAVMAVVAAGTEVIVEALKPILGLKRKFTALEALDRTAELLPSQLTALGVDKFQREAVSQYISKVKKIAKPYPQAADAFEAVLKEPDKDNLYKAFQAICPVFGVNPDKVEDLVKHQLGTHAGDVKTHVGNAVDELQKNLGLSPQYFTRLKADVEDKMGEYEAHASMGDVLGGIAKLLQKKAPDIVDDWLERQAGTLASQGKEEVMKLFEANVVPAMKDIGLGAYTGDMQRGLEATLIELESAFSGAVQKLLEALEEARTETQSMIKKVIWRLFRELEGWPAKPPSTVWDHIKTWWPGLVNAPRPVSTVRPTTVAANVVKHEEQHQEEEMVRVRRIRSVSFLVGVFLAKALDVNALSLLQDAMPNLGSIGAIATKQFRYLPRGWNAGILVTALAASFGSRFWHDFLGRLAGARRQAEEIAFTLRKVKEITGKTEGK